MGQLIMHAINGYEQNTWEFWCQRNGLGLQPRLCDDAKSEGVLYMAEQ
jgi:hypothetical protein